jgi:hypothetical protein
MADTKLKRVTMTMAKCSFISLDSTRSISISFCVPIEARCLIRKIGVFFRGGGTYDGAAAPACPVR